jgi:hypothetical protein
VDNKDKLKRLLKNVSFDSEVRINVHSGYFDINYRLEFLGEKDMISVGDWVTYNVFDVTILDMDEKLKKIIKIFGDLTSTSLLTDYVFVSDVSAGVRNELQYFSPSTMQYVQINKIKLSPNLEKEINDIDMSKLFTKN